MAISDVKHASEIMGESQVATGTCEKHGAWELKTFEKVPDRHKTCPSCKSEEQAAKQAEEAAAKVKAATDRRIARLAKCGVFERHLTKTFDAFIAENSEQSTALDRCKALVDAVRSEQPRVPSLILSGNPGTGKSHLSCAMVIALSDAGYSACRVGVADLIREFKDSWRKDSEYNEADVLDFYGSLSLMVLEEIGVQHGTDTERMFVFEVMNRRYEQCLPTVLVSNLDAKRLTEEVGERVMDRLREDGGKLLRFTGESWRKA